MKIEIQRVTSWTDVLNAARFTQRKEPRSGEPSIAWKKKIIKSEHSPLRCLMFNIDLYDIPRYVSDHLVRHVHTQPFVSTGRSDVLKENLPRDEQKMTDLYNTRLFLNAQEIINISKVRLCNKAEKTTREIWRQVIEELRKTEPELAAACVPSCIYRGHCPEIKSCGFADLETFPLMVNDYINSLN
jgi:thymidylate synthase ThyX